jgi:hypothetical protein
MSEKETHRENKSSEKFGEEFSEPFASNFQLIHDSEHWYVSGKCVGLRDLRKSLNISSYYRRCQWSSGSIRKEDTLVYRRQSQGKKDWMKSASSREKIGCWSGITPLVDDKQKYCIDDEKNQASKENEYQIDKERINKMFWRNVRWWWVKVVSTHCLKRWGFKQWAS